MVKLSEAQTLLKASGIGVPGKVANTLEDALAMKRPLVLKADTDEHKTDKGLVFVSLTDDAEIREAFTKISNHAPVFAQPMIKGEEIIVGIVNDPTFGKTIMFGAGGIFTELYKDTSFRSLPITPRDAEAMVGETQIGKIFSGFRGRTYPKKAMVDLLVAVGRLAIRGEFSELDLNPVIVNEKGVWVVDVRMI